MDYLATCQVGRFVAANSSGDEHSLMKLKSGGCAWTVTADRIGLNPEKFETKLIKARAVHLTVPNALARRSTSERGHTSKPDQTRSAPHRGARYAPGIASLGVPSQGAVANERRARFMQ
jgi:hypothetical protein